MLWLMLIYSYHDINLMLVFNHRLLFLKAMIFVLSFDRFVLVFIPLFQLILVFIFCSNNLSIKDQTKSSFIKHPFNHGFQEPKFQKLFEQDHIIS